MAFVAVVFKLILTVAISLTRTAPLIGQWICYRSKSNLTDHSTYQWHLNFSRRNYPSIMSNHSHLFDRLPLYFSSRYLNQARNFLESRHFKGSILLVCAFYNVSLTLGLFLGRTSAHSLELLTRSLQKLIESGRPDWSGILSVRKLPLDT